MKKRVLMSWSSGKDSAWALYKIIQNPEYEVIGLFSTVNKVFNRVAMHGVRKELLIKQGESLGFPLTIIEIPYPCANEEYERIMEEFVVGAKNNQIDCFAFGDIFLEDVKNYRIEKLKGSGIEPIFPLWGMNSGRLSSEIIEQGVKTVLTCLDPTKIDEKFIGQKYSKKLLNSFPSNIDPCGENGEFHTFVFDGPMFKKKIDINFGEQVNRDGFLFIDVF